MNPKGLLVRALGARPIAAGLKGVLGDRLRVLAYHGVDNQDDLDRHLSGVLKNYTIVSGEEVVAAARGGFALPSDAVWITFDDGLDSVVENALPVLKARGTTATLFVCPGLVESTRLPWWTVVETALLSGWTIDDVQPSQTVHMLKTVPDSQRRQRVEAAIQFLENQADRPLTPTMAGSTALQVWLAAGNQLGNHTWDHPCLDQCDESEQRRQIESADTWLSNFGAFTSGRVFAYPNGDWTQTSEHTLRDLGYDVALLFDHRSSPLKAWNPLRTSRYRIDTTASNQRARAIISGAHSLLLREKTSLQA